MKYRCSSNFSIQNFSSSGGDLEVIVSDGGSVDDTVKKVEEIAGSVEKQVRVINSEKGKDYLISIKLVDLLVTILRNVLQESRIFSKC